MANKPRHRRFGNIRKRASGRYQVRYPGPDGRLRAVPLLGRAGPAGVSLRAARSEQELFRAELEPSARVRVAFSADGQFLLANRESAQASAVDVWEL